MPRIGMIDDKTIDRLNAIPLAEVMRNNGFSVTAETGTETFYRCPFHKEENGSFCVSKFPPKGMRYAAFHCFACAKENGSEGVGAIMLQQKLLRLGGGEGGFMEAVNRLAKDFNLTVGGDWKNGFFHRARKVEPQPSVSFRIREGAFTEEELRALGCRMAPLMEASAEGDGRMEAVTDEAGRNVLRCSFNPEYYRSRGAAPFDGEELKRMFSLYPLESYITPQRPDGEGGLVSYEVKATPAYPVFLFKYEAGGCRWARKYEPYFRESEEKGRRANYKFTWWYEDGKKPEGMYRELYGDSDVMRALESGKVETSDRTGHPLCRVERRSENGGKVQVDVFERIVICSGPRDAINVYFHSGAHVVWPHSESREISSATMKKLFALARNVYILYDIDRTGIREMNRTAMKYVDLKVVYLPEDLKRMFNPRTGKPCKDAEEFFSFYPEMMRKNEYLNGMSVNRYFDDLLKTAKRMKFWDVVYQTKRDEDGDRYATRKYTLNFDNMAQFLSANGFYRYTDEADTTKFVLVRNNIVDVVEENQALAVAKDIMKDFLVYNSQYYSEDLSNAISTQKRIGKDAMSGIKTIKLNFMSWGKDFEYFFFRNCAVKVTADSIEPVDYIDLPFHVNRKAIIDRDFRPQKAPLFSITENPEYAARKELNRKRMENKELTDSERDRENAEFIAFARLYRFRLSMEREEEKMPICMRWLYDTSRIHWRKEETGMPLNAEERQRQDMHFVCKVALMGYMLSRYREGAMQKMGCVTEYSVVDEGKNSGGTGKSFFRSLFEMVRKVCWIDGRALKKKENMAKNFDKFHYTVDSMCFIDDLRSDIVGDEFYNITENITVKTLYRDEMTLPRECTPKIFVTMNKFPFDLSEGSTARRIFLAMQSDYYHDADYSGKMQERTPKSKFGKDIIKEATEEEQDETVWMMLQSCQFYLSLQESLIPPMARDGQMRILYSSLRDASFIEWANSFFASEWHWGRPLSIQELCIGWLEHRGDEVTAMTVKAARNELMQKLSVYCENMQYTMNPAVVFRADKGSKYPRHYAWETEWLNDRIRKPERVRKYTRCCFFYRLGEEPRDAKDILPCPEEDREMEERTRMEEDN